MRALRDEFLKSLASAEVIGYYDVSLGQCLI